MQKGGRRESCIESGSMIVGITMQQATGVGPPHHVSEAEVTPDETGTEKYESVAQDPPTSLSTYETPSMGSTLPAHQVYVDPATGQMIDPSLGEIENQFHSLEIGADEAGYQESQQHAESSGNASAENDGEEAEDDPLKLFVGQVPKSMSEEDIFPTFDSFGPLKDVAIIRDRHTGLHRGCAFVTFWASEDAERAQEALHDNFTFPGARRPAQVKPAEPSVPENKLFIGMLSRKATEEDVRALFEPHGEIREIYLIRNADGSSKCAAFLRFVKRESAEAAMEALNDTTMEGGTRPLIVRFADNKHQRQQRQMRTVKRQELMAAMGGGFVPYPQVPPMGMHPGAPPYPMQIPQYAASGYGPPPLAGQPPGHPYMYPTPYGHAAPYAAYPQQQQQQHHHPQPPPQEEMRQTATPRPREGPAGANLFVYHLPHDLTDADLATAFNPFGNVISAKVYVDKYTGESKGFGFVSYDSVISAEAAIEQMNGFQIGNKRLKVQHKRVHNQGPT